MTEAVLFPDAVGVAIDVLTAMAGAPAHGRVPDPRPSRFYRVRRTGGPQHSRVVDGAQLTVESWSTDDTDAHDMAQLARQALHASSGTVVGGVTIYLVEELSGPGDLPDPLSDQARVSQTFVFPTRGT